MMVEIWPKFIYNNPKITKAFQWPLFSCNLVKFHHKKKHHHGDKKGKTITHNPTPPKPQTIT
jgi:hypothetical protein